MSVPASCFVQFHVRFCVSVSAQDKYMIRVYVGEYKLLISIMSCSEMHVNTLFKTSQAGWIMNHYGCSDVSSAGLRFTVMHVHTCRLLAAPRRAAPCRAAPCRAADALKRCSKAENEKGLHLPNSSQIIPSYKLNIRQTNRASNILNTYL